ncbi:winged-helix domain-containing protein [Haladaptatus salinisoli]|uniref:winged-helix domain-containing protein n=1 Tax=Haladaptatus salinisoli TaxID=2884876 RepID=UPI001D0A075F|nr:winged-helix domain-containing protein [Haladaptatus salinisoli]
MTGNDDSILEYLHEKDVSLPPAPLHYNLERSGYSIGYSTVRRRLQLLEAHRLVEKEKEKEGYYAISDKGRKYLAGDLEAEDLEHG